MSAVDCDFELANTNRDSEKSAQIVWDPPVYRCHICIIKEDDGGFSAIVLNLPGCGSCGDTEEEAIENAMEAVLAVIESHQDDGEDIPWTDAENSDIPKDAKQKWILVNA